ncbi:MAG: endonuclease [Bacilli bacterium]|nr:endonuclease [Bacilli bacterium]
MKNKHKRGLTAFIILPLLAFTSLHPVIKSVALDLMPTNINIVDLHDTDVNQYYDGVEGLKGDPLLESLSTIIDGHREYDYENNTHRYIYKIIDRNWALSPLTAVELSNYDYVNDNPFIHKLYADYNDSAETADRFKNDGATRVSFDKEHIWAQSLGNFGRTGGAGSDFHSLWPSDVKGNQQGHSNYNFAVPTSGISDYNNDYGTYVGRNGYISGAEQKVFEPLDQYKGDIARAMFYMPARYYTYIDVLHPKLELVNGSPSAIVASNTQSGLAGDLETLLLWNELDPVDQYEVHRNNLIYNNYQLNRNPFIDHPEWAEIIYDPLYDGPGASLADGSSTAAGLPDAPHQLSSISVDLRDDNRKFTFLQSIKADDFIVTAHYLDGTSAIVSEVEVVVINQSDLILKTVGEQVIEVTYQEVDITKTMTITINVELAVWQMIIIGVVGLIIIVIIISSPKLSKLAKRKIRR